MRGYGRRLGFEQLEDRRLLAGVTLITHGFNSNVDGWVSEMAAAISSRADLSGIDLASYRVEVTDPGHDGGPLSVVNTTSSGPSLTDSQTDFPEIVILLNWSDVAGTLSLTGGYTRSTTDVAAAVAEKLFMPDFLSGLPAAVAELPMHLLGHSRGASLVGALARELGELGVWVDQVTTFDPHPVDGVREPSWPFNFDFGDAAMTSWDSVVYWDNYWRTQGATSLDFTGESIPGTFDVQLSETVLANGGYANEHSDVHLWYYGTIDTSTDPPANNGDYDVPNNWYGDPHPDRDSSGYYYSRLVGGSRELSGLSSYLGGTALRTETELSNAVWANVLELNVDSASLEFVAGDPIPITFYFQWFEDAEQDAVVEFSLDVDRNPFNGNENVLGQQSFGETGRAPSWEEIDLPTVNAPTGTYYLSASVTNATGQIRSTFSLNPISISAAAIPTALLNVEDVATSGGASHDFTVTYSDDVAIDVSDLGTGDVVVTGPSSFQSTATFVNVDINSDGTPRTATYRVMAPGGSWDSSDYGTYVVSMNTAEVSDTSENQVEAGALGAFQVSNSNHFVVNDTGDGGDTNPGDGIAVTASGTTTLRAAIQEANALANAALIDPDLITFNIAGAGPLTIQPLSALPMITDAVIIDGTTEPDFAETPVIELDGSSAGSGVNGLNITSGGSTVRGLAIGGFRASGIELSGGGGNTIEGNFIGTDVTGTLKRANTLGGVRILNSANNTIGGTTASAHNLLSGNGQYGMTIDGASANNNVVQGNLIGLSASGSGDVGNARSGVFISDAPSNTIGGAAANAGNLISGNDQHGVLIAGGGATNNIVQGNLIGTNTAGTMDFGNNFSGVRIVDAPSNTIGGAAANAGNVISGNDQHGVLITGASSTNNFVQGNLIGTSSAGTADLGNTASGVVISGDSSSNTVGGLTAPARNVISGNNEYGVMIAGAASTNNVVQGNLIGLSVNGSDKIGNARSGVFISDAPSNLIGRTGCGLRNVISGNAQHGVLILGAGATNNSVSGNLIGTNSAGTAALGNTFSGVRIVDAPSNTTGGTSAGARNIISGNDQNGVLITGDSSNVVWGNFIGTNVTGSVGVGNLFSGVQVSFAPSNTVGGTTVAARNVISGNERFGVIISGAPATGNAVQGNFIGLNASGSGEVANTRSGVYINFASSNTIGGTAANAGNVISGNAQHGVMILGHLSANNVVQGNLIGTDSAGTAALGNLFSGVRVIDSPSNTIGGTAADAGNVISANAQHGVAITGEVSDNNIVQGNFIGTDVGGTLTLGNILRGVQVSNGDNNAIGGTTANAGNTVAFNGQQGVGIFGTATGNRIQRNSIFSNSKLGIDLLGNGVTPNDANDPDAGPNNLQNFPLITSASSSGGNTTITGTLNSTPNSSFTVEFFSSLTADPSGNGEGQTFLHAETVITNGSGDGAIDAAFAATIPPGQVVTATATDATGNTSEFSAAITVSSTLLAAGGERSAGSQESRDKSLLGQGARVESLEPEDVNLIADAALARLSATGLSAEQLATLSSVSFAIADLPGAQLGLAGGNTITLDINAAGYGWFIDPTPLDDSEFSPSASSNQESMDLLTVVFHEMGHAIGLDDDYSDPDSDDIMNGWLPTGVRRLPTAGDLDALFGSSELLNEVLQ